MRDTCRKDEILVGRDVIFLISDPVRTGPVYTIDKDELIDGFFPFPKMILGFRIISDVGDMQRDMSSFIEMKSGKADEYSIRNKVEPKENNKVQMLLYQAVLQNLENVGWCKPGHEGYYNIYIMEEVQTILSAGAGGSTKLVADGGKRMQRIFNFKYPNEDIQRFAEVLERKKGVAEFYDHNLGTETTG